MTRLWVHQANHPQRARRAKRCMPLSTHTDLPIKPLRAELLLRASRHRLAAVLARGLQQAEVPHDARVVLSVSGGGDSMAMLVLMAALRDRTDGGLASMAVVAIDHAIRAENAEEARQAIALARHLGVLAAEVRRVEVARSGNTLDAARNARLAAVRDFAASCNATHVLLAHQADDRAEGLLLALGRGAGINAAASLLPARTLSEGPGAGLVLCRPLLAVRREELRAFLREMDVSWRDDPSNAMRARGSMRGDPSIAALVDGIATGAGDFLEEAAQLLALREDLLDQALPAGAVAIARARFDALPRALHAQALIRLVRHAGSSASRVTIDAAVASMASADRTPRQYGCQSGVVLMVDAREVRALTSR